MRDMKQRVALAAWKVFGLVAGAALLGGLGYAWLLGVGLVAEDYGWREAYLYVALSLAFATWLGWWLLGNWRQEAR